MVQPSKYKWLEFEWDQHNLEEITAHQLQPWEAEECFYGPHRVFKNKRKKGRTYETFKLLGRSKNGRQILLIFFLKGKRSVGVGATTAIIRVITEWEY